MIDLTCLNNSYLHTNLLTPWHERRDKWTKVLMLTGCNKLQPCSDDKVCSIQHFLS